MMSIQTNVAGEITRLHHEITTHLRSSLEKAVRIGELLTQQKAALPHGGFLPWLAANVPFTSRTATNYMRLHEHRDTLKSETVSDLASAYALLRQPRQLPAGDTPAEPLPDWMPQHGQMNMGRHVVGRHEEHVYLVHRRAGYVEVYKVGGDDFGEGFVEGCRRGIRLDHVCEMLYDLRVDPEHVDFLGAVPIDGDAARMAKGLSDWLEPEWSRRHRTTTEATT